MGWVGGSKVRRGVGMGRRVGAWGDGRLGGVIRKGGRG